MCATQGSKKLRTIFAGMTSVKERRRKESASPVASL
jgi:hypothetical protein